jgi:hypothetical protein
LKVDEKTEAEKYWGVRGVHLSHLNMVWCVWELGGRPTSGKSIDPRFDGWEIFAREILVKKLRASAAAVKNGGKSVHDLAASDLWHGLSTYESVPRKFVDWLNDLDNTARE